jgi:hypothetical protein
VDFTREPIVETVITPKDGCKLVVRSSKSSGQEEYFVDAVEVVAFGNALFFRSIEKPKAFLVPATDYEILEVREARMVLKNVGVERTIKIGGGRESAPKAPKEPAYERTEPAQHSEPATAGAETAVNAGEAKHDARLDQKRDNKRRHTRRRRGREGEPGWSEEAGGEVQPVGTEKEGAATTPQLEGEAKPAIVVPFVSSLLPPPPTLISESIARYRDNAMFKGAFFIKDNDAPRGAVGEESSGQLSSDSLDVTPEHSEEILEALDMQNVSLEPSAYGTFDAIEEENERTAFLQDQEDAVSADLPSEPVEPPSPPEPPEHLLNNPH